MSNSNKGYSRNSGAKQSLSENLAASRHTNKGLSPKQPASESYFVVSPNKNMRATQNLSLAKSSGEPASVTDLISSLNQKPKVSLLHGSRTRNLGAQSLGRSEIVHSNAAAKPQFATMKNQQASPHNYSGRFGQNPALKGPQ